MKTPNIVSGVVATMTELDKDEAWLQGWLREQPNRLGLGELQIADGTDEDDRAFAATDEERCYSVDVQLGEMEASRGFGVLDNWARNRVRHPDKTHVAVLVTETISDRYQTTLTTLAEHLPLVVVELQVWRGEDEAIVVPHVALASDDVDLSSTPAARAAEAIAKTEPGARDAAEDEAAADTEPEAEGTGADATLEAEDVESVMPENKDDTGVPDPWGLPRTEPEADSVETNGRESEATELLSEVGNS